MLLVGLAALIAVACGSSIPVSPSGAGATPSTSSLQLESTSPGASPGAGFDAPTPELSRTVDIPEVPCPTTFGLPGATMPPLPATMTATVTPEVAALVTYYGNGTLTLLGPKGWQCAATISVDGSARMSVTTAPSASLAPDEQAVTASTGGACSSCIASMACSLFPEARNLFSQPGAACPTTSPVLEQVTRPRPRSAVFVDPPGVAGTGEPSGGRYRAIGFVIFGPGAAAEAGGQSAPSAHKVTCTLPDTMAQICDELVEGIGRGQ